MELCLFNFLEKKNDKFNLQRVVGKAAKLAMNYSPKCHIFWCNSIRVVEKIQKDMSVERSIFADVLSYQLITSTLLTDEAESLKLNGSREKKNHTSFHMEQLQTKKWNSNNITNVFH